MAAQQSKAIQVAAHLQGAKVIPWTKYAQLGPYYQAEALAGHAAAQAEAGLTAAAKRTFHKALSAAEKVEGFYWKDKLFGTIATLQAQAGFFGDASNTAKRIEDPKQCAENLNTIVASGKGCLQGKKLRAFDTATDIEKGHCYLVERLARRAFAEEMESGLTAAAKKTFKKAISAVKKVDELGWKNELFFSIAIMQAECDFFQDAVQTAKKIANPSRCAKTLKAIASLEGEAGNKLKTEQWVPSPP